MWLFLKFIDNSKGIVGGSVEETHQAPKGPFVFIKVPHYKKWDKNFGELSKLPPGQDGWATKVVLQNKQR